MIEMIDDLFRDFVYHCAGLSVRIVGKDGEDVVAPVRATYTGE